MGTDIIPERTVLFPGAYYIYLTAGEGLLVRTPRRLRACLHGGGGLQLVGGGTRLSI